MEYTAPFAHSTTAPAADERSTGINVYLRRLANPHLPPNDHVTAAFPGQARGSAYNPYITVDYLANVPLRDTVQPALPYASRGKKQPYASYTIPGASLPYTDPNSPTVNTDPSETSAQNVLHTFGRPNRPAAHSPATDPGNGRYDWLVHLDRRPISPLELLHVSAYPPHLLTQMFMRGDNTPPAPPNPADQFQHYAQWFDQRNRLYRLFDFLEVKDRALGSPSGGRTTGRINLNTVWDVETFQALCDANTSNWISGASNDLVVRQMFQAMVAVRTPNNGIPGPTNAAPGPGQDRPFLSLTTGHTLANATPQYLQHRGINDTILRARTPADAAGDATAVRLFQNRTDFTQLAGRPHPYQQWELLTKIYNNVTVRSNVFAVWVTVGFFEVTDASTTPPTLGAEVGRSEGRHVRHRMFAIIDRSRLESFSTTSPVDINAINGTFPIRLSGATQNGNTLRGTNPNTGRLWAVHDGSFLIYDPKTDDEETVVVRWNQTLGRLEATFTKIHPPGAQVIQCGNPGPWPKYDPRKDTDVVLYFSIIG
jgi:hypothetical protein